MNPFSKYLSQFLGCDKDISHFIAHWDVLEALVIRLYKVKMVTAEDAQLFATNWPWLRERYPGWKAKLAPYWSEALVGGQPASRDPFQRLLEVERPESFFEDWEALQYLPAAREALNQFLVVSGRD